MKAITELTITEMVAEHNKRAKAKGLKPVKSFKDRATAMARVKALRNSKAKGKKTTNGRQSRTVEFPWPAARKLAEHTIRPVSKNAVLIALLKKGATEAAMAKAVQKHYKDIGKKCTEDQATARAKRTMRFLNRKVGYGVRKSGDKYHLVTPR